MLKKIAYVCRWALDQESGVTNKINAQIKAWRAEGAEVRLFCRSPHSTSDKPAEGIYAAGRASLLRPYMHILQAMREFDPQVVYCRYEIPTLFTLRMARCFGARLAVEINTDDMREMEALSAKDFWHYYPRKLLNNSLRAGLLGRCGCFVSPTRELLEAASFRRFKKPGIIAPNSIDLSRYGVIKKVPPEGAPTEFIFIGSPGQPWHGVEKVVKLAEAMGKDFVFHIIGPDPQDGAPANVLWHGFLPAAQYMDIAARCAVGIGTLALHRKGMEEACPIKVREYLALGLPVLLGYQDSALSPLEGQDAPEWVCSIPNTEDSMNAGNVEKIREFALRMRGRIVGHAESGPYISAALLEKKRLAALREWFEGCTAAR